MLLFRSEEEVENWSQQSGEAQGELVPFAQIWRLAQLWYGSRMQPDYRGRSAAEVEQIFAGLGLESHFWRF